MKKSQTAVKTGQAAPPTATSVQNRQAIHIKDTLIRLIAFHLGYILPEGMSASQRPSIFTEEELLQIIPGQLTGVRDESIQEIILQRILQETRQLQRGRQPAAVDFAAQVELLFPDHAQRMKFIDILEKEPLPNTEKQLRRMKEELLESLQWEMQKRNFEELKRQGDLKALNAMLFTPNQPS